MSSQFKSVAPGLAVAVALMLTSLAVSAFAGRVLLEARGINPEGRPSPISAVTIAILSGIVIANLIRPGEWIKPGLEFAIKRILRFGIILVGIKLSFSDVFELGAWGLPVVTIIIAAALGLSSIGARIFRVSPALALLTAASTAICGVTAAVATAPVIEADERELAYTVANVTLFGVCAMFLYPHLAHFLFPDIPASAGLFLGTAIHDTSQVMGAALSYREVYGDDVAFRVATVTKLTRNLFIAVVVPLLGYLHARRRGTHGVSNSGTPLVPLFVLGFLAMSLVRSVGDWSAAGGAPAFGLVSPSSWTWFTKAAGDQWSYFALGTAMAAVGLRTDLSILRTLGLRPLYLGAAVALLVGALGLTLAAIVGPMIHLG